MTKENGNILWTVELYSRAKQFEEDCERAFLPLLSPRDIRDLCESGAGLLYLLRTHATAVWERGLKDFAGLQLTDDVEKPWEDRSWSDILEMWGHALDIEEALLAGTHDVGDFFRQNLAAFAREHESKEWYKTTKRWIESFFGRSVSLARKISSELYAELKQVEFKKNPMPRLVLIEYALVAFEYCFLQHAAAVGPYLPPADYSLDDFPFPWDDGNVDVELAPAPGVLRTKLRTGSVLCSFRPRRKSTSASVIKWKLEGSEQFAGYGCESYKNFLFETWDYETGEFLGEWETDQMAYWLVTGGPWCFSIGYDACEVERLSFPLFANEDYEQLANRIVELVRNNRAKWWPGRVRWSYVKELDDLIIQLRDTRRIQQVKQKGPIMDTSSTDHKGIDVSEIPCEHKSPPMSLKVLAGYFGRDTNARKVSMMIRRGSIKAEMITRESYFFDLRTLPAYVQKQIKQVK
jgi:hypothetical protein